MQHVLPEGRDYIIIKRGLLAHGEPDLGKLGALHELEVLVLHLVALHHVAREP